MFLKFCNEFSEVNYKVGFVKIELIFFYQRLATSQDNTSIHSNSMCFH